MLEIPEEALREVVMNAIVHRNYTLQGPIKIAIYEDRLEIFSPGNFAGPLDTRHLEMGLTYIRNTIIARVMREAKYIEKLGSGFLILFTSYRERKLSRPQVIDGPGFIKCILPRPQKRWKIQTQENNNAILNLFHGGSGVSVSDVI